MTNNLVGITNITDTTPSLLIEEGLVEFLDWGFLSIGNFVNVEDETMILDSNPNYTSGQVWRCSNDNLVWQSGLGALTGEDETYPGVSGIYINGSHTPVSTTGNYSYSLDHINGRVIFDTAVSATSDITISYSRKYIDILPVKDLNHIQEIFEEKTGFTLVGSGDYFNDPRSTIDSPFIGVELVPRRKFRPLQLGGGQYMENDVLFHCVSSDKEEVNKMADIVSMQNDRVIRLLDQDKIYNSGIYPINYNGVPQSGALRYPDLINGYQHSKTLRLFDAAMESKASSLGMNIIKTVRISAEIALNIT